MEYYEEGYSAIRKKSVDKDILKSIKDPSALAITVKVSLWHFLMEVKYELKNVNHLVIPIICRIFASEIRKQNV